MGQPSFLGQPSFYRATVALSFQIEIYNLERTKSSLLATSLYKKSNFHQKLSYKVLSPDWRCAFLLLIFTYFWRIWGQWGDTMHHFVTMQQKNNTEWMLPIWGSLPRWWRPAGSGRGQRRLPWTSGHQTGPWLWWCGRDWSARSGLAASYCPGIEGCTWTVVERDCIKRGINQPFQGHVLEIWIHYPCLQDGHCAKNEIKYRLMGRILTITFDYT